MIVVTVALALLVLILLTVAVLALNKLGTALRQKAETQQALVLHCETHRWTREDVERERKDAAYRSRAVVAGHSAEKMWPLTREFLASFNPREAHFLGSPIDYVVFDGLHEGECEIVFVEIKTQRNGGITINQRRVRDAVGAKRVRWLEIRVPSGSEGHHARTRRSQTPPWRPPPGEPLFSGLSAEPPLRGQDGGEAGELL